MHFKQGACKPTQHTHTRHTSTHNLPHPLWVWRGVRRTSVFIPCSTSRGCACCHIIVELTQITVISVCVFCALCILVRAEGSCYTVRTCVHVDIGLEVAWLVWSVVVAILAGCFSVRWHVVALALKWSLVLKPGAACFLLTDCVVYRTCILL